MINILRKLCSSFKKRNLPNFLIIGVQKAGTTTLFDMLNQQNGFYGASVKEVGFYSKDKFFNLGEKWYSSQFEHANKHDLKFEATPEYFYYDYVPQRVYQSNPEAKFIVILREPASRCYSAWNMFKTFNEFNAHDIYQQFTQHSNEKHRAAISDLLFADHFPSFKDAVDDDIKRLHLNSPIQEPSFVRRGVYHTQLGYYLKYFDASNFLFLEQSELDEPSLVMKKIGQFLNVNTDQKMINNFQSNVGRYDNQGKEIQDTMYKLKEFYRPHNEALFKLIGKRYTWND